MHKYRTHKCNELRIENVNDHIKLSGWVHRKRDHGQLIFVDLRDHYGISQIVSDTQKDTFDILEKISLESVISVQGKVVERSDETINHNIPTGEVELQVDKIFILSNLSRINVNSSNLFSMPRSLEKLNNIFLLFILSETPFNPKSLTILSYSIQSSISCHRELLPIISASH